MQAIAREFNLAETVFVMQPANPEHRAMLRIFTPKAELPFAGHPTVGTAVLLGCMSGYNLGVHDMVLEETVGPVHCTVEAQGRERGRASFVLPRLPERIGGPVGADEAAAALGAERGRYRVRHPVALVGRACRRISYPCAISTRWHARGPAASFDAVFGREGPAIAYLYCGETA